MPFEIKRFGVCLSWMIVSILTSKEPRGTHGMDSRESVFMLSPMASSEARLVGRHGVSLKPEIGDDRLSVRCWKAVVVRRSSVCVGPGTANLFLVCSSSSSCRETFPSVCVLPLWPYSTRWLPLHTHTHTHTLASVADPGSFLAVYSTQCFTVQQIKRAAKLWVCLLQLWPTPNPRCTSSAALFPHFPRFFPLQLSLPSLILSPTSDSPARFHREVCFPSTSQF